MGGKLNDSEEVINRVGAARFAEYAELEPMVGCTGFAVRRPYPTDTVLGQVLTTGGRPCVVCLIQFVVESTATSGGVRSVSVHVMPYNRWERKQWAIPPSLRTLDSSDPDSPTPESLRLLNQAPRPIPLDFFGGEFFYDGAEDKFFHGSREVTGKEVLDYTYGYHCRTLRPWFRVKWRLAQIVCQAIQAVVWRGQDLCMWLLQHGYDIVLTPPDLRWPLHQYHFSEFTRTTDKDNTSFFGFITSKRSLSSNLVVLALTCICIYYGMPRFGLVRAVYANTALTTTALLFGFLLADQGTPLALKSLVCLFSRLRLPTMFIRRKVRA